MGNMDVSLFDVLRIIWFCASFASLATPEDHAGVGFEIIQTIEGWHTDPLPSDEEVAKIIWEIITSKQQKMHN